ncbi:MAG TPA: tetratricopeptide repeat protein [Ktedonobacterales bacterium]|nr:tetratricopeptide repeat protein [Ktedonobacterales bacterium]
MTQDEPLAFGDLLRRHRIFAGMSQEELAERAGLSARAISDLERGVKRVPRRDTLQLLVEALDLSGDARTAFIATARAPAARPAHQQHAAGAGHTEADHAPRIQTARTARAGLSGSALPVLPVGGFLGATPHGSLVGRETELAALLTDAEAAMRGAGRLMMVAGEPGIGKTRLSQQVMLACRDRAFLVGTGRCYEPHQAAPYYPFLEALSTLYTTAPESIRAAIPTRWPLLLRLLPDQLSAPGAAPATVGGSQEEHLRLFWAVTGFVRALAEDAPVTLLLDDLHWADDASIELLQHLARHTHSHRVLLLGTYRDIDLGRQHPLARALRDLEREHLVTRIPLHRLELAETTRLIAETMGQDISEEFAELVYAHTDGNPLFIQEVLRAMIERGDVYRRDGRWERNEIAGIEVPESVRATIADRVSRLSEPAQEALREASILGQAFDFEDLAAMGARSEDTLDAALEEALAAGLLQESRNDGYIFNHALTQQGLYRDLSVRRRRKLHLAAGDALERLPERLRTRRAAELAWHFREGGAPERALHYALLAGDYARSLYATGEAEQHYRTALGLAESLDDWASAALAREKLGWLMWLLARFDASAETLERAATGYRELGDTEGEMRAVGLLGMLYFTVGPLEGVRRVTTLLDRLGAPEPSKSLASLYVSLAMNLLIAGEYSETVAAAERGVAVARAVGDTRMLVWAETTRGPALGLLGHLAEARRVGEEAIPVAEAAKDYFGVLSAVHYLGDMCIAEGDFIAALKYYDRALKLAERLGAQSRISAETANLAEVRFYLGDWERARAEVGRAVEIARAASSGRAASYFQYANVFRQFAVIHAALGEWDEAIPYLEEAVTLAERLPFPEAMRNSQRLLAEYDLMRSRPEAALARLEPLVKAVDPEERGMARLLPCLALAYDALGQHAEAERLLTEGISRARAQHYRLALVELLTLHGASLTGQHRLEGAGAARSLDEALALARSMAYPYAEARALYEQGRLRASAREWRQARDRFEDALGIFRRLGARPDIARTEQELAECALA